VDAKTKARCNELADEAKARVRNWPDQFADDYSGKVMFSLALATASSALCDIVPGLKHSADEFILAVKAITELWVESGEPDGPQTERTQ